MELSDYFEKTKGTGVLATADGNGKVNAAIYSRPHFISSDTLAFIAADKLTHANLQSNPQAVYLFKEEGSYEGRRLYLTKIREEKDSPLIDEISRKKYPPAEGKDGTASRYLIFFRLDSMLPLIGDGR